MHFLSLENQVTVQNESLIVHSNKELDSMFAISHLPCSPSYHIIDLPPCKISASPPNSDMSKGNSSSSESDTGIASPSQSVLPIPSVSSRCSQSVSASCSCSMQKAPGVTFNHEECKYLKALVPQYVNYCNKPESQKKGAK
jgi:hypothetical protein